VGGQPVVVHLAAGRPLERELADGLAQQLVIVPHLRGHLGRRKARLVGEQLDDRDLALAVGLEARHVRGHGVRERQRAAVGEQPHRARRQHLGVRVEQPERVVRGGHTRGIEPRVAQRAGQRQLAVARDGQLRAGITALGHVAGHELHQALEGGGIEAELRGRRRRQRIRHGDLRG